MVYETGYLRVAGVIFSEKGVETMGLTMQLQVIVAF